MTGNHLDLNIYLALLLPVLIALQCVRNIKHLTLASTLANLLQLAGMAIILYNLSIDIQPISERKLIGNKFPMFFVTTIFNFEGISIVSIIFLNIKNFKLKFHVELSGNATLRRNEKSEGVRQNVRCSRHCDRVHHFVQLHSWFSWLLEIWRRCGTKCYDLTA